MRSTRTLLTVLLVATLLTALAPVAASAKGTDKKTGVRAQGTSYAFDNYDLSGLGDGTPALARDLTALMPDYGFDRKEDHTLHSTAGAGDSDWFKFTVTADEVNIDAIEYLFRTRGSVYNMDTVIDVYGPHATSSFSYTPAAYSRGGDTTYAVDWNDDTEWAVYTWNSGMVFAPPAAGTYYVRVRPFAYTDATFGYEAADYDLYVKKGNIGREYGLDRISTALEVSRWQYQQASGGPASTHRAVVLANAYNYPDALAGSLLAGISDGPLLLTKGDRLPAEVAGEIMRLGVDTVYVVGGQGVVADQVIFDILDLFPPGDMTVTRAYGANRIETAADVVNAAVMDAGSYFEAISDVAIVAYAYNYPDALAASAYATKNNVPILLTGTSTLSQEASAAMTAAGTSDVLIMGGTGVISANVENQLIGRFGAGHVKRFAGVNRYETAKLFASWSSDLVGPGVVGDGLCGTQAAPGLTTALDPTKFGIASGDTFADALPGGVACGQAGSLTGYPLLLVSGTWPYGYLMEEYDGALGAGHTDWVADYNAEYDTTPWGQIVMFGGTGAISQVTGSVLDNNLMQFNR